MAKNKINGFISIICSVLVISVRCNDNNKFKSNFRIFQQISANFFTNSDFTMTNAILEIMVHDWNENHECLNELNTIKNGILNIDEWAVARELIFCFQLEN